MRARCAGAALSILLMLGGTGLAQSPAPKPRPPSAEMAPPPAPVKRETPPPAPPAAKAAPTHRPGATDRLIPPAPAVAGSAPLVPNTPPGPDTNEPTAADEAPPGPPMREQLHESGLSFALCRLQLTALGVSYRVDPPILPADDPDCGIARPLTVTEINPGIALIGSAQMRCGTALALGLWVRDVVQPATRRLPGSPQLSGMMLGTAYQCRAVVGGTSTARLSEHAFGNAIDIAGFRFADGSEIPVMPRQDSGDLPMAFQSAVQAGACLDFTTVLGPGSNAAHDNHLHLDIKARRGGYRLCQ